MPAADDPRSVYEERRSRFEALRREEARRSRLVSFARLFAFLFAIGFGVAAELRPGPAFVLLALGAVTAFIALVVVHGGIHRREDWWTALRDLNEEGMRRLDREWARLPARISPLGDPHGVAADLDLFGRPALAQLLGPVATVAGKATLAGWLMRGADPDEIVARQEAVGELAAAIDLREALAGHGRATLAHDAREIEPFLAWAEGPPALRHARWISVAAWALPLLTLIAIGLALLGRVPGTLWLLPVLGSVALTAGPGSAIRRTFRDAFSREAMFEGYPAMFAACAEYGARSERLRTLQAQLAAEGVTAAEQMRRFVRVMHLADMRHSGMMYAIVQFFLLWDFHVHARVERWRRAAGPHVRGWLVALGEVEALAALATLAHDHPGWAWPTIEREGEPRIEAEALGHPMLPGGRRVTNDVTLGPPGTFLFITGSNMSGKSTLLRAIGANVVLAGAGAPVCAARMRLPVLDVRTSIHVQDSLVDGVSFFMAQLQRLKDVVEAADRAASAESDRPLLYLLDEILQGTNTAERRVAATRVIRHLVDARAIGAVTTHDLELGETPELAAAAQAVHFTEQVSETDGTVAMRFDYRLRPGIATSTNALNLMRVVGLNP